MTTIDLMRHGETAPGICLGSHFDAALTDAGWIQMRSVFDWMLLPWHGIVSSPLTRCAAFAEELANRQHIPLMHEPRWRELGFGDWEGRSWLDLYRHEGDKILAFQRQPGPNPAPGGEHYADFEARVMQAWREWSERMRGEHWLVVTHAGVLRVILRHILGFPPNRLFSIHIPYAGLTRIEKHGSKHPARLVFHGGRP